MRKPLIIGNWKMNTSLSDAVYLTTAIKNAVAELDVDVVLCPPFTWLYPMTEILEKSSKNIHLGAQNMWFAQSGAVTGEISPLMVKALAKYVILGHSERRSIFKEDNDLINDKVQSAIKHNLVPIICVGELKKNGNKAEIISELKAALKDVSADDAEKCKIAYEPVWAIGTGNSATGAYAGDVIQSLREFISEKYNQHVADRIKILYGGSVDSENIKEFIYQPEIDGTLVGGASLKAKEFIRICREAAGRE